MRCQNEQQEPEYFNSLLILSTPDASQPFLIFKKLPTCDTTPEKSCTNFLFLAACSFLSVLEAHSLLLCMQLLWATLLLSSALSFGSSVQRYE